MKNTSHFSKKPFSPTLKATEETNSTPGQCIQKRHQTSSSVKFFYLQKVKKKWNAGTRQAQESGRWISFAWHWNESLVSRISCIIFSLSSLRTHHPVRTERFLLPAWETWHHSHIHKSIKIFISKVSFFWCLSWKKNRGAGSKSMEALCCHAWNKKIPSISRYYKDIILLWDKYHVMWTYHVTAWKITRKKVMLLQKKNHVIMKKGYVKISNYYMII